MDCPQISKLSYNEFSASVHNAFMHRHVPLDCSFEITYACNLRCGQCYCGYDPAQKELGLQEVCKIIDEIADAGCLWLLLTGGEPLMRPDFLDIYAHAKRRGLIIFLFTNGTLMTPAIADFLSEYRPFIIEMTLYGATKETYEKVTGVAGSFEKCMRGIALMKERNLPLRLKTTVTVDNKHELQQAKEYAQKLGVAFRFDAVLNPAYSGGRKPAQLRISPQEVVELDLADDDVMKGWKEFYKKFWSLYYPQEIFSCAAGKNSCHIDPYGKLQICMMVKKFTFDILKGTFAKGWAEFIPKLRQMKYQSESQCKGCKVIPICDQCAGWAHLEHNDLEKPVDYLCQIAHLRAQAFGMGGESERKSDECN